MQVKVGDTYRFINNTDLYSGMLTKNKLYKIKQVAEHTAAITYDDGLYQHWDIGVFNGTVPGYFEKVEKINKKRNLPNWF